VAGWLLCDALTLRRALTISQRHDLYILPPRPVFVVIFTVNPTGLCVGPIRSTSGITFWSKVSLC